jgi:hypothetical protein
MRNEKASDPRTRSTRLLGRYEGPGQKYGEYRAPYQYGHRRALKTPVAGYPSRFIHIRDKAPVTTGHRLLIVRIIVPFWRLFAKITGLYPDRGATELFGVLLTILIRCPIFSIRLTGVLRTEDPAKSLRTIPSSGSQNLH